MAGREPQDSYNPLQTVAPTTSAPNDYSTVHANSDAFGSQVGQAISGLGEQVKQTDSDAVGVYLKYQGQLNELTATNADADLAEKIGNIKAEYQSKEGMDAVASKDQYVKAIRDAQTQIIGQMPNLATQRAFAVMTAKSTAYAIKDMGDYAASQFKSAQKQTNAAALNQAKLQMGDPAVAADETRSNDALQTTKFYVQQAMQLDGQWPTDTTTDEKGNPTFSSTPAGQQAAILYKNRLDQEQGAAQILRFKTLIDDPRIGADKAWEVYQQDEGNMTAATKASVLAMIRPRVVDAQTRSIADQTAADWHQKYLGSFNNGQGNTGDFDSSWGFTLKHEGGYSAHDANGAPVNFGINQSAHPEVDVSKLTPDTAKPIAKSGYWDQIHVDSLPANMRAAAFDTAYIFGPQAAQKMIDQSGNDPQKLIDIRAQHMQDLINKDPQKYGKFTNAWEQRNNDLRAFSKNVSSGPQSQTNPNGGHMSEADFLETHWDQYIEDARTEASNRGLDAQAVDLAEARAKSRGMNMIEAQHMKDRADSDLVAQALSGKFNNDVPLTHEYQLQYGPPEVRDAWQNLQIRDPLVANDIVNRRLPSNATQSNKGYGNEFYRLYQGVQSGAINNTAKLLQLSGDDISNSAITLLQQKMKERNTPEGIAYASAESKFMQQLHNDATGQGLYPGLKSATLEKAYVKQLPSVFKRIEIERANHTPPAQMFNPDSPHYVGDAFELPKNSVVQAEMNSQMMVQAGRKLSNKQPEEKPSRALATKMWNQGKFKNVGELRKYLEDNKITDPAPTVPMGGQ